MAAGQFAASGTSASPSQKSNKGLLSWLTGSKKNMSADADLANAQQAAMVAIQQQRQLEEMLAKQQEEARKDKDQLVQQMEQLTKLHSLEKEKAELQVRKLTADLEAAIAERDEAVCAATRAMMVPALDGEELDALMSVLPEDEQEKEKTRLSLSPPAKFPVSSLASPSSDAVPPANVGMLAHTGEAVGKTYV